MGMWDKVKAFFGYAESKQKPEKVDTSQYKEKEKELNDILKQLDEKYNESNKRPTLAEIMPQEPNYEKLQYNGKDKQQIENEVYQKNLDKKNMDLDILQDSFLQDIYNTNNKIEQTKNSSKSKLEAIGNALTDKLEETDNKFIDKGLARSSIKSATKEFDEKTFDEHKSQEIDKMQDNLKELDSKLDDLQKKQQYAIGQLDLSYATKMDAEINKLVKERETEIKNIEKYNNDIQNKTLSYKENRQKSIENEIVKKNQEAMKLEENEIKYGYSGEKKVNYDKRLNMTLDFYLGLPKEVASQMVKENHYLQSYLGNNYGKLISAIAKR